MKTDSKILASFLAASIWADDEYDEFEKQFVADVCNELGTKNLQAELEAAIAADARMAKARAARGKGFIWKNVPLIYASKH